MYKAILFDLDNTLLWNPMEVFYQAFDFENCLASLMPLETAIQALDVGFKAVDACEGNGLTIAATFWAAFCLVVGRRPEELDSLVEQYFAKEFSKLQRITRTLPEARYVVELAFERGLKVVIATGMLLPRTAVEQRLAWAGIPVTEFDYTLVADWDIMHASKPYVGYYQEILDYIGQVAEECLMVGDNWEEDIVPAFNVGMAVYWIAEPDKASPAPGLPLLGQGTLVDFWSWFKNEYK